MKTIKLKNINGDIIFTYTKEGNTVKDTVIEAINQRISLRSVDLSDADLSQANLRYVDLRENVLRGVDLRYADLRDANLSHAYLFGSNLSFANLAGSDLTGTNLVFSNLRYVDLSQANLNGSRFNYSKRLLPCKWKISIIDKDIITIGCETKSIKDWEIWFAGNDVYTTSRDTDEFRLIYANYVNVRNYIFLIKD